MRALSAEKWQDPTLVGRITNTATNAVNVAGGTLGGFWSGIARGVGADLYADALNDGAINLLADTKVDNAVGKFAQDVFGGVISMIPMAAAAPLGPVAGMMVGAGLFSAGSHMNSAYNEYIDAGLTHEQAVSQARAEAVAAGAVTAASVFVLGPLAAKVASKVPALNYIIASAGARVAQARGATAAAVTIAKEGLWEGMQEMTEQVATDIATNALKTDSVFREFRKDLFNLDYLKELAYTGAVGAGAGGGFAATGNGCRGRR